MPCFKPLDAWTHLPAGLNQKHVIRFTKSLMKPTPTHLDWQQMQIPCGQCIGCRIDHSKGWAIRCIHEASLHDENCFITLTYDNEHLPFPDGSLIKEHFQLFMKRLRKHYTGKKIKFYQCGEYGENFGRPHYHAILFGHDFKDRELYKVNNGVPLDTSETLSKIWGKGFVSVGDVTFESAAYVARYIMKKVTGEQAEEHYEKIDEITGEVYNLQPEYTTMSRGGRSGKGLSHEWFKKYKTDVFPDDFVLNKNKKIKTPRYYNNIFQHDYPEEYEHIKEKRKEKLKTHKHNNTRERLKTREHILKQKLNLLKKVLK